MSPANSIRLSISVTLLKAVSFVHKEANNVRLSLLALTDITCQNHQSHFRRSIRACSVHNQSSVPPSCTVSAGVQRSERINANSIANVRWSTKSFGRRASCKGRIEEGGD